MRTDFDIERQLYFVLEKYFIPRYMCVQFSLCVFSACYGFLTKNVKKDLQKNQSTYE